MAEDSGGLGGLLGWFGRPYDPQAAYEGLLSSQPTKDALRARSLASIAQAFGAGAGSDARGSAIPFGTTMGNAAAAAYSGQDALIAARNVAAEQMLHAAQAQKTTAEAAGLPIQFKMMQAFFDQQQKDAAGGKPAPLSPASLLANQQKGGGGGDETYWTPQGLAALRPTEGAYDQIHYPSGSPSSATGAYGFLDKTWQEQAPKAGVDIEKYPRAYLAPPELQDKVAAITPISHWTGTDAKGNPYNFRAQRLATNPAFVTGGAAPAEPRQAGGGGREPTAAETAIYAQTPGTVQNAARRAPTDSAFWNTAQPTGTLGAAPSGAPLGPAVAPPTPPGGTPATSPAAARGLLDLPIVPDYTGKLGGAAPPATPQGQGAALVPGGSPPSLLTQQDPVTARTIDAIAAAGPRRGAPGINAADAGAGMGSIVAPGAVAGAAPPVDPRLATLAQRVAGPGAPSGEPPAPAAPPAAGGLLGGGALQRTIDQAGGGLLNAPPPAAPPVAPPAGAVPPAAAPGPLGAPPVMPGTPALPPMPAMPAPPQMRDVPVPPMPAPTTLEGMAQAISGISSLTGHPAPAFMQDLAKMPAARQQELYKAYLLAETNSMNERYKTELQAAAAHYISAATAAGKAPWEMQQDLAKQGMYYDPQDKQLKYIPGKVAAMGIDRQQAADIEETKQKNVDAAKIAGESAERIRQKQAEIDAQTANLPKQKRIETLNEIYKTDIAAPADAARKSQATVATLGNALNEYMTGPSGAFRLEAGKRVTEVASLLGFKPSTETLRALAAGEIITKQGTSLGYQVAKELGSREAAMVVQQAIAANPNILNSDTGNRKLVQLISTGLQRDIDKQDFYDKHFDTTGSYEGARQAFEKANPWQHRVSEVVPFQMQNAAEARQKLPSGTWYRLPGDPDDGNARRVR